MISPELVKIGKLKREPPSDEEIGQGDIHIAGLQLRKTDVLPPMLPQLRISGEAAPTALYRWPNYFGHGTREA
jgi:hypothetical protein